MYLVDTNVISEARRRNIQAVSWIRSVDATELFISVITLGEIMRGVVIRRRTDPIAAAHLASWLDTLEQDYGNRILPIFNEIALTWGKLSASRTRGEADGLIAATAIIHNLRLVTRNIKDFADTGVALLDPWAP